MSTEEHFIGAGLRRARVGCIQSRVIFPSQPEDEALHDVRFELQQLLVRRHRILDPDLDSVLHANHLHAQPVVVGHGEQGTGEHQVGMECFSNLRGGEISPRQRENRVACQYQDPRRTLRGQPPRDFLGNGGAEMFGHVVAGGKRHNRHPQQRPILGTMVPNRAHQAITPFVDRLNALLGFEPGAQRRQAARNALGRNVHVAPKRLF